jgi:hypothetical protein
MKSGGEMQNKASMKGETRAHKSAGSESIRSEEKVGSSGPHGVQFSVPKGVVDHSCVRGPIGKE